jgi:hypothetical protein
MYVYIYSMSVRQLAVGTHGTLSSLLVDQAIEGSVKH